MRAAAPLRKKAAATTLARRPWPAGEETLAGGLEALAESPARFPGNRAQSFPGRLRRLDLGGAGLPPRLRLAPRAHGVGGEGFLEPLRERRAVGGLGLGQQCLHLGTELLHAR